MSPSPQFTTERTIIEYLCATFPDIGAIYIYGSFGTKYETQKSDIDIAILFPLGFQAKWSKWEFWSRAQELGILLKKEIDLVYLNDASTVFSYEILLQGRRIYVKNESEINEIEFYYFARYLRFQESRLFLIEEYLKGKK